MTSSFDDLREIYRDSTPASGLPIHATMREISEAAGVTQHQAKYAARSREIALPGTSGKTRRFDRLAQAELLAAIAETAADERFRNEPALRRIDRLLPLLKDDYARELRDYWPAVLRVIAERSILHRHTDEIDAEVEKQLDAFRKAAPHIGQLRRMAAQRDSLKALYQS